MVTCCEPIASVIGGFFVPTDTIVSGGGWQPRVAGGSRLHSVGSSIRARPRPAKDGQPYQPPENDPRHPPPEAATRNVVSHLCTFVQELRSDLHLCTASISGPRVLQSSSPALSLPVRISLPRLDLGKQLGAFAFFEVVGELHPFGQKAAVTFDLFR